MSPEDRGCYCDTWATQPEAMAALGYQHGFCGTCQVCGAPGHTRHFPGPVPYTGSWCDEHYGRLRRYDPRSTVGCLFWLLIVGGAGVTAWRAWVLLVG